MKPKILLYFIVLIIIKNKIKKKRFKEFDYNLGLSGIYKFYFLKKISK